MSKFQPPIGLSFVSPHEVNASDLSALLCKTAAFIQAASPYITLEQYDDWWEHDGLHFYRKTISLENLFQVVRSPKSLLESMPGDLDVVLGIYSKDLPLYLRFYVDWNDSETELIGRFDITLSGVAADRYRDEIVSSCDLKIMEMDSVKYYQSIIL